MSASIEAAEGFAGRLLVDHDLPDADEDQIVDAEHDLEEDERTKSQPSRGICNPFHGVRYSLEKMEKDGYWLAGSGYGYGYPMYGFGFGLGYGYGPYGDFQNARSGYELRTLVASANILARQGKQQSCEDVLAATRNVYNVYVADMRGGKVPPVDLQGWRQMEIAAAKPVTSMNTSFRTDELVGTDVRNPQNEALGSVEDLVMSPQADKIAYLVIARGGIFGIDEKHVPVPWEAFKTSPNGKLLVLDTTKSVMDAAPLVNRNQFATPGQFDQEGQKVDAYWQAHLAH